MVKKVQKTGSEATTVKKPRKRQEIPANETKAQRFVRVATPKLRRAIKTVRMLVGTANKRVYEYSDAQVDRIITSLKNALSEVERSFSGALIESDGFSLDIPSDEKKE